MAADGIRLTVKSLSGEETIFEHVSLQSRVEALKALIVQRIPAAATCDRVVLRAQELEMEDSKTLVEYLQADGIVYLVMAFKSVQRLTEEQFVQAAEVGDMELIKAGLRQGLDPSTADMSGRTALWGALKGGHDPVVDLLLVQQRGVEAAVKARTSWEQGVMDAVVVSRKNFGGRKERVLQLIALKAELFRETRTGYTLLHALCQPLVHRSEDEAKADSASRVVLAQWLLEQPPALKALTTRPRMAVALPHIYAREQGQPDLAQLYRKAGGHLLPTLELCVKTLNGDEALIDVDKDVTVKEFKLAVCDRIEGWQDTDITNVLLKVNGEELIDHKRVLDYELKDGDEVLAVKTAGRRWNHDDLIEAMRDGSLEPYGQEFQDALAQLCTDRTDLNTPADNGDTLLMSAVTNDQGMAVVRLLEAKAEVNGKSSRGGSCPLLMSQSCSRKQRVIERLVEAKADWNAHDAEGASVLHNVVHCEHTEVAVDNINRYLALGGRQCLLAQNQEKQVPWEFVQGSADAIGHEGPQKTKLITIASYLKKLTEELQAQKEFVPQPRRWTVEEVEVEIREGNVGAVRDALASNQVSVNAQRKNGEYLLTHAVFQSRPAVVQLLIEQKADVSARTTSGNTALIVAGMYVVSLEDTFAVVHQLLAAKADPCVVNSNNETVLHFLAASYDKQEMCAPAVDRFLALGAVPCLSIHNQDGLTPFALATKSNNPLIAERLKPRNDPAVPAPSPSESKVPTDTDRASGK